MTRRQPQVGDIWAWESYSSKDYYLLLNIELKQERQPSDDGLFVMVKHTYYDLLSLADGKIYTDYSCYDMSNDQGWVFIC